MKLDTDIYRNKGSLRITDNNIWYKTNLLQISFYSKEDCERRQKVKDSVKAKAICDETKQSVEKATEQYLKANKLDGWKFRAAKVYKSCTIVNLDRQNGAKSYCDICKRHHDKDNCLYLKMTAKKIELCCMKNRAQ